MVRKAQASNGQDTVTLPGRLGNKAQSAQPGRAGGAGNAIPNDANPVALNSSIAAVRAQTNAVAALRLLADQEGAFSFAVFSYVQAARSGYTITAYRPDTNQFDPIGTQLAYQITNRIDTLFDYTVGYSDRAPIDALIETMLRDVALSGGVASELVLNKDRLPERISSFAYETVRWVVKNDGANVFPQQSVSGGEPIDLDVPNVFIAEMSKGSDKAYATSFLLGALKQVFYYAEFVEDMRRTVRRAGHSRVVFKLDYEAIKKSAPHDIQQDPERLSAFLDRVREDFSANMSALAPEDAVVVYDLVEVEGIDAKGEKADYKEIMEAISGLLATSVKTHPSILGLRLGGSQSLSNTESLIFIKGAAALQTPVASVMSRMLTLAARLYGSDVYVNFSFNPIDLRPESELEAFRTMRQQRVIQALSLGWVTDDEASHLLGYGPRAPGAPDLAGTMFMNNNEAFDAALRASPNNDPQGRALQPDTPNRAGGDSQ